MNKIEVSIIALNEQEDPLELIGWCAGLSTSRSGINDQRRAIRCIEAGHESVLEYFVITCRIYGISRACSHQLVRHRLASYTQESQRYTKIDTDSDWYVTPEALSESGTYKVAMRVAADSYNAALKNGIKPEDARYMIPNAARTSIVMTCNLRQFLSIYRQRTDAGAQEEIRYMVRLMRDALLEKVPQLEFLFYTDEVNEDA